MTKIFALLALLMLTGSAMASLTMANGRFRVAKGEAAEVQMGRREGEKALSAMVTPEKGFTRTMHDFLEMKHVETLARLGRKDTRRAVVPDPQIEGGDDGAAEMARRGWGDNGVARPNYMELGEAGCSDVLNACQYGLSCQNNVCIGPAKAGESCVASASGFMCETGSFCRCTDSTRDSCTCIEEKKEGTCEYQIECTGGYVCNWDYSTSPTVGTCAAMGSVEAGGIAIDDVLCEYGLYFDDTTGPNGVCTETSNTCADDGDCALTYSGSVGLFSAFYSDGIFFTCSGGNCVNNGPNCKSGFSSFASLAKKEKANNYGAGVELDYSAVGYKLQKCLYDDHVTDKYKGGFPYSKTGQPSSGSFPFFHESDWDDTTWLSEGAACTSTTARCEIGLRCRNDVCFFPHKEGESCAGDNDLCEAGTHCYNATTCMPNLKGGAACHYESDTGYVARTECSLGYGCNLDVDTSAGSRIRRDGFCVEYATLEVAQSASDVYFCSYGLRSLDEGGDYPVCRGFVDETCNSFGDCDFYFDNAYEPIRDYDYDYYWPEIPAHKWDYGFGPGIAYLEGHLLYCSSNVTDSSCVFNEETMKCAKLFHKYLTYDKGYDGKARRPTGDAERCALSRCIYDAVTYKDFAPCNAAAGLLPAPVLVLLALVLAVFLH